jgi:hypothetical protein
MLEDTFENSTKIQQTAVGAPEENFGIFGHINMPTGPHLILIKRATLVGSLLKCQIFRVEQLLFVPINNASNPSIHSNDQPFVDMIQKLQNDRAFYFSYNMDLTKRI